MAVNAHTSYDKDNRTVRESPPINELFPTVDELGFDTCSNTNNPLLDIASPLLGLVVRLEGTERYDHVEQLYAYVKNQIHTMVEQVRRLEHHDARDPVVFSYCLCCVVDEAVMATPWGVDSPWKAQSLLGAIHQETGGGERFFNVLERLLEAPEGRHDLFVFLFWCLALGYQGKYANQTRGDDELDLWLKRLHEQIVAQRGVARPCEPLTDPLANVAPRHYRMKRQVPWWTPWVVVGVCCCAIYLYLASTLDGITRQVLASLEAMLPP
ncbi:DotU family type IV/VI secretion system protein [Pseudomonas sp. BW16M2]|uniref:type IVB secretion system protein IcmH/DotU n=1 Tax=Pseudomonas sp. BW16M2 TaxID=2745489 RepID=UPI001646C189|nr:type IVB secretion system protein IcmH/DotU [Pseudomonas sp. BW16M2]MBC3435921.1 DotU family type IV/VI secretion system protein [Pseudomonas sp. BW16M2]